MKGIAAIIDEAVSDKEHDDETVHERRGRRRRGVPRARSIAIKHITREKLRLGALENPPVDVARPRTRGECIDGPRPCPFVACKHHLYLDVNPETGTIKINFPHLEAWELTNSCVLDVADEGVSTLERVGELLNVTRERSRQIELKGLFALKELGLDLRGDR